MTQKQREAKIEALEEAAQHLEHQGWSDNKEELKQGRLLALELRRRIDRLMKGSQ
jgi:hypothetical protein